jgi:HEAT repeat protein
MLRFLDKLFNIRAEEWPRLLLLYLMLFAVTLGAVWGETIVAAAFLEQVGLRALPWFFMVRALLSVPAVALYTAFADRVAHRKLLVAILGIGIAGIALGLALLNLGLHEVAFPLLYLLIYVPLTDILSVQWYTYVNGFYDTRAAKRVIPVLGTAGSVGSIIAGLSMESLNRVLPPTGVILVWAGLLGVMALLVWLLPHLLREERTPAPLPSSRVSYLEELREGYAYVSQSSFLRWIALATLALIPMLTFVDYQTSQIVLDQLQTTEAMANFYGRITGLANLVMLPIQLFLLSRIIGRIGVGDAYLMYPVGNLLICGGLILRPGLLTAALGYFDITVFYGNIGYQINSLLYNAVPLRVKGRARAFIDGLIVPLGAFVGSVLLLRPFAQWPWFLPAATLILATTYIVTALVVRRQYSQALVTMLEQEDYSFLLSQSAADLTITDPATLNKLREKLEASTSHEITVFMAQLIGQIGGREALPILERAAKGAEQPHTRAAILDVLSTTDLRGPAVQALYRDFLQDDAGEVRQSALTGLQQLVAPDDPEFVQLLLDLGMVQDPDIDVRAHVLGLLVNTERFDELALAVRTLEALLADERPQHRVYGVRVLGQQIQERAAYRVLRYLDDPADAVRLEAALAVEALARTPAFTDLIKDEAEAYARAMLDDPIERVRQAALGVLGRIGQRSAYRAMVDALADSSSRVRATAVDALARVGDAVVPLVHPKLESADAQVRKMATVILSRVNPREFAPLIVGTNVTGNLLAIYTQYGLVEALDAQQAFPSVTVLQSALREECQRLADELFYLLGAVHDPDAVDIIRESLDSENPRTRANAAEALESLTTPKSARLIAPLFEPELPMDRLLDVSRETWDMEPPDAAQAFDMLLEDGGDPWLRAITVFALGEMGAALAPKPAEPAEPAPPSRRRRKPPGDLFGALDDPPSEPAPEPAATKPRRRRKPPTDLFGALGGDEDAGDDAPPAAPEPAPDVAFNLPEIQARLERAVQDRAVEVRAAAQAAQRMLDGVQLSDLMKEEAVMLSTIEKVIFLKEVPFFQGMTIDQLKVLASVCEEEMFEEDARIYNKGDAGGVLYVVVNGRVGIEQEKRTGSFARLATIRAHSYFGEMNLFDNSPRSTSAVAIQDTLTLRLRREPLIALARQHPEMSLALINVLSERLRDANDRVADLTRSRPSQLNKLFDQYE